MNNTVKGLLIFAAGAAVGSVATWQFVKKKYERIAQEEIDSVKEVFSRKQESSIPDEEEPEEAPYDFTKEEVQEQKDIVEECGYMQKEDIKSAKPTVISPDEFGEIDEYDEVSLTYYIDGVLADENDEPVEDVDNVIGFESLNHFGEYEDDSVFVRNDKLRSDFEILLDQRNYSDVIKTKPHPVEE